MKSIKINDDDYLRLEETRLFLMRKGRIKSLTKIDLFSLILKAYNERILKRDES